MNLANSFEDNDLGYADVIELREQLIHANVSFATEIIDIQDNINVALDKVLSVEFDTSSSSYSAVDRDDNEFNW